MKLTVVMSVFDGERYVAQAARSTLAQTFTDFEFIVVDNGSTDGTNEVLNALAATDPRLMVVSNPQPGNYAEGRAVGIAMAKTEWVALMDADDICHPARLERQVAFIDSQADGLGALGTWARYIDAQGNVVGQMRTGPADLAEFQARFRAREPLVLLDPSAVFHRPSYLAVGGYRPDAAPAADIDLWYRIAELGRPILALPEILMDYRVHSGSESTNRHLLQRRKTHYINYNMRRRRDGSSEIGWREFEADVWKRMSYRIPRLCRDLGFVYFRRAAMRFAAGRYVRAAALLLAATLLHPGLAGKRIAAQLRWRTRSADA